MFFATVFAFIVEIVVCVPGRRFEGRVKDLQFGLVLKLSRPWGPKEPDIIRFVQRHTTIPTPRILASDEGYGTHYCLMKRVEGEVLSSIWATLGPARRTKIVEQLRSFIAQLRSLESPHGSAICSWNGSALREFRITSDGPVGPFADEDAFNDRLIQTTALYDERVSCPEYRARLRGDHAIVFTHGDIAPPNIIVEGDTIVALLDWEQAGWYPKHWEMVKAMWAPPGAESARDIWTEAVKDMFDKDYEVEWQVERDLSWRIDGPL